MSPKSGFEADCRCSRACDSGIQSGRYYVRFGVPGNGSSMISDPGSPALHRRPSRPILNSLTPAQNAPALPLCGTKGVAGLARQRPSTSRLSGKLTDAASVLMTRPLTTAMGWGRLFQETPDQGEIFENCHFLLSRDVGFVSISAGNWRSTATDSGLRSGLRCQPRFGGHRAVAHNPFDEGDTPSLSSPDLPELLFLQHMIPERDESR